MDTEIIKQWNLPKGAQVKQHNGEILTFKKMDGMYAQWTTEKGEQAIGNFTNGFRKEGNYYVPIIIVEIK